MFCLIRLYEGAAAVMPFSQKKKTAPIGAALIAYSFRVSDSLIVAAATEHEDYCKNDDPGAVVIEDVA